MSFESFACYPCTRFLHNTPLYLITLCALFTSAFEQDYEINLILGNDPPTHFFLTVACLLRSFTR